MHRRDWYWVGFVACQVIGAVLPGFGNVHLNVAPILLGFVLLLPGAFVTLLFETLPYAAQLAIAVAVNYGAWWIVSKTFAPKSKRPESSDGNGMVAHEDSNSR